jgi:hypothetical protein
MKFPFPEGLSPSSHFEVFVNGQNIFVYECEVGSYAIFECADKVEVIIRCAVKPEGLVIRPLNHDIRPIFEGREIRFSLYGPQQLYLDFEGETLPLFIFVNPPEEKPDFDDPSVIAFRAGRVYEAGEITLTSGQTLFIEGGALVRGTIRGVEADNIRICGTGIVDGSRIRTGSTRLIVLEGCKNVRVNGITTVGTPSWNLVFGACENIQVDNVKLIGWVVGSDGIDVVGTRDVRIENSFFRCNDDCVVIKALEKRPNWRWQLGWDKPVENVLVQGCVLYNARAGNAMEVGFETQTESIRNITFRDCDVIGAHGDGSVFSIHNGDRALIENILWEDIRVEHFYTLLIDFRVVDSRWSYNKTRGQIRNVTLRNIRATADIFNTPSLIGGYDQTYDIQNVRIEDFQIGGVTVTSCDELNLFSRHASGIEFSS